MPPISFYNLYEGSCHCSLSKTTIRAYRKRPMAWNLLITIRFNLELYNSNFLFSSNSKLIFPLEWKVEGKTTVANIVNKTVKKSRRSKFQFINAQRAKNSKNGKIEYYKLMLAKNPLTIVIKFSFLMFAGSWLNLWLAPWPSTLSWRRSISYRNQPTNIVEQINGLFSIW